MDDSIRVIAYLLCVPTPRQSGVDALHFLDDHEVDPRQVLSVARERHHQGVNVVEIRQRAVGRPWDGRAWAATLRRLPVHPRNKIHHQQEGEVQLGVAMLTAYIRRVAPRQARRERRAAGRRQLALGQPSRAATRPGPQ